MSDFIFLLTTEFLDDIFSEILLLNSTLILSHIFKLNSQLDTVWLPRRNFLRNRISQSLEIGLSDHLYTGWDNYHHLKSLNLRDPEENLYHQNYTKGANIRR